MDIPKPTEADKQLFRELVPMDSRVEIKPMFGNLGAFVNGNMFMGLFGSDIGVKLPPTELVQLREAGGEPFGPADRPMGGYLGLPPNAEPEQIAHWVGSALDYVAGQPPKKPRSGKR